MLGCLTLLRFINSRQLGLFVQCRSQSAQVVEDPEGRRLGTGQEGWEMTLRVIEDEECQGDTQGPG